MKKYIILLITAFAFIFTSCNDQLDTVNLYQKDLDSFYSTPEEVDEAISGIYNAIYMTDSGSETQIFLNLLSDCMLGGGGTDDEGAKWVDSFQDPEEDTYEDLWTTTYNGIYRANAVIEALQTKDYSDYFISSEEAEAFKSKSLGEAYFMRGWFFFRAAQVFGGLPLIITTDTDRSLPRASIDDTYAQVFSDFLLALNDFPDTKASEFTTAEYGHANKWVTEAYIARAYLYYTGYKTNILKETTTDVTISDTETLTKDDVISYLQDCIDNSSYALISDFRNLWPYSYVNTASKEANGDNVDILPWAADNNLAWAGQDGFHPSIGTGNTEVMFAKRYAFGNWSWSNPQGKTNRYSLFFGIRDNSLIPFGQGWGWGPVNTYFYNQWDDNDLRKEASVLELKDDASNGLSGIALYKGTQYTGLVNKKYTNLQINGENGVKGMFCYLYGLTYPDMQLWHAQDQIEMRFADVLLMQSELTEDPQYMNKVRERVGLEDIEYSLENLKEERAHELAFESLRWYDLIRWGDVETSNNYWSQPLDITNNGVDASYSVSYRTETKGLLSIPETEIRLSNGVYEQNPGWSE